jgi:hypothetical protein
LNPPVRLQRTADRPRHGEARAGRPQSAEDRSEFT